MASIQPLRISSGMQRAHFGDIEPLFALSNNSFAPLPRQKLISGISGSIKHWCIPTFDVLKPDFAFLLKLLK